MSLEDTDQLRDLEQGQWAHCLSSYQRANLTSLKCQRNVVQIHRDDFHDRRSQRIAIGSTYSEQREENQLGGQNVSMESQVLRY